MLKDNIKKARLQAGLTQKEVSEKLGIAQPNYARYEQGKRIPKIDTLEKLAHIFQTTTDSLKGRYDGLEDIISTLRENEPTEEDKAVIRSFLESYFKDKR